MPLYAVENIFDLCDVLFLEPVEAAVDPENIPELLLRLLYGLGRESLFCEL